MVSYIAKLHETKLESIKLSTKCINMENTFKRHLRGSVLRAFFYVVFPVSLFHGFIVILFIPELLQNNICKLGLVKTKAVIINNIYGVSKKTTLLQ